MTIAHIGGLPVEEWLVVLAATGGGIAVALRAAFRRGRVSSVLSRRR